MFSVHGVPCAEWSVVGAALGYSPALFIHGPHMKISPPTHAVTAVIGPTNTGKTHLAVERMLAHESGMIGLPLRLLAREVYDRARLRAGDHAVALMTGEEKIIPAEPRYWVCTVEAMPSNVEVAFLAIDELQVAADLERGHVFTDRLLHRRGRDETLLLGSTTIRPVLEELLPKATFVTRPRFSKLTYSGHKKLTRLPRRTAIICFSAENVYAVAELVRRQRGGAAVVLGALSPRTRNAQVALYQSGDVDFLVATDAIGMGLNMDLDHVAFAATRKFDGYSFRELTAAELGQIAGRAGRYLNDGSFCVTGDVRPFDTDMVRRLEEHNFEPLRILQWRNRDLDCQSIESLKASLNAFPRHHCLTRAQAAADLLALDLVGAEPDINDYVSGPGDVELLWEVCQIPDYRNISSAEHSGIVGRIFRFLRSGNGRIPKDWFERQLSFCNHDSGDIDTLSNRIAHVRTWTFVANRSGWLEDPTYWQDRTQAIEDKLSDALHERLAQRFIDRRTSVLMKRLNQRERLMSTVEQDGAIHVEGEYVGHIKGFQFIPDGVAAGVAHERTLKSASLEAVVQEISLRAQAVSAATDPDLTLTPDGQIVWQSAPVARLVSGPSILKPRVEILADDQLGGPERDAVQLRLERWLARHIAQVLEPLVKLADDELLVGLARGLAFRLVEQLGVILRDDVAEDVKGLPQEERASLRKHGVRFGAFHIFVPLLLKPAATELRLLLWSLELEKSEQFDRAKLPKPPGQGLVSVLFDRSTPKGYYRTAGFRICGQRCVRIDMLERLADLIRDRVFWKPRIDGEMRPAGSMEGGGFCIVPDMMSFVGCSGEEFTTILRSLGFRSLKRPKPQAESSGAGTPPLSQASILSDTHGVEATASALPSLVSLIESEGEFAPPADAAAALPESMPQSSQSEWVDAQGEPTSSAPASAPPDPLPPGELPVAASDTEAVASAVRNEVTAAPETIEVWWPRDTGPFRRHSQPVRPKGRPTKTEPRRSDQKVEHQHSDRKTEPKHSGQKKEKIRKQTPRSEKRPAVDPDSPFAVLGELRAQLSAKKNA